MNALNKSSSKLCEFCHKKPKNGPHPYCGKACAGNAALLCDYCHVKPKHVPHHYCTKNCAAQANNNNNNSSQFVPAGAQYTVNAGLPGLGQVTLKGSAGCPGNNNTSVVPKSQKHSGSAANGQQIGRGQVTVTVGGASLPVLGPSLVANQPPPPTGPHGYVVVPPASQIPVANVRSGAKSAPNPNGKLSHGATKHARGVAYADECRIPGCGEPVYDDGSDDDYPSEYCSVRHRDEAVKLGLESPCIMCLALPQSGTDYFCGRYCREDALNKV